MNVSRVILKNSPRIKGYKPNSRIGLSHPKIAPSHSNPNKYTGVNAINNLIKIEIKLSLTIYLIKNFLLKIIFLENKKPAINAEKINPIKYPPVGPIK